MSVLSARLALVFSCVAHLFAHLFEPIFFIAALVLPKEFGLPYDQILTLIVAGKLLYGVLAPLAGWLGDRWSAVGMMAVYFLGVGASAVLVGLAPTPFWVAVALAALGAFGSIYHPVGIAWVVRSAQNVGAAIGVNGLFGGIGPGVGGAVAALLIGAAGWRAAFIVPGVACLGVGVVFVVLIARGVVVEVKADHRPAPAIDKGDAVRAAIVLSLTMLCGGLIYQAIQPALPKLFEDRLGAGGLSGVATAVTAAYMIAGLTQVVAGRLTDLASPKMFYIGSALVQAPLLLVLPHLTGLGLAAGATLALAANMAGAPAENIMIARYTPMRWRGTAFGMKFILAFGVSGLGVPLVSVLHAATGGFGLLFVVLGLCAVIVATASLLLPSGKSVGM